MADKFLCVLGSDDSEVMDLAAVDFFSNTGNGHSRIVIISDEQKETVQLRAFLLRHNITNYTVLHPDISDYTSLQRAVHKLKTASGIILDTTLNVHTACSVQPLKGLIVELYNAGIPILGTVAHSSLLHATPTVRKEKFLQGNSLGLLTDHIICSPKNSSATHLSDCMTRLGVRHGVEIGHKSCAVFINGSLVRTRGDSVLHIEAHVKHSLRLSQIR